MVTSVSDEPIDPL